MAVVYHEFIFTLAIKVLPDLCIDFEFRNFMIITCVALHEEIGLLLPVYRRLKWIQQHVTGYNLSVYHGQRNSSDSSAKGKPYFIRTTEHH